MTDPRLPADSNAHAAHDALLIAALADLGAEALTATERDRATALVATCSDCATLHADLVALAVAIPVAATPPRPRDFRLSPDDAARLRPAGWRRFLAGIGSSRDTITRPLALGLTTLGLVGLLVGTVPGALSLSSSSGTILSTVGSPIDAGAAPAAAASAAASTEGLTVTTPPPSVDNGGVFEGGDNGDQPAVTNAAPQAGAEATNAAEAAIRDDSSGLSALLVVAGAFLIAGLGLFALRWSARRT
jgi:hypothetical protein